MPLLMNDGAYLSAKEAAKALGITHGTFRNKRTDQGDRFLVGHELMPGRIFFRLEDVEKKAREVSI